MEKAKCLTEFTWIYRLYRNTARFPCRAFDDSSSSFYQQWHVIEHIKLYVLSPFRHVSVHTHHPQKIILAIRSWKSTAVHVTVKSFILLDCCTIKWLCKRLLKCYKVKQNNIVRSYIQGGSNMTGTNCDLFTHKSSLSYLNYLVLIKQTSILRRLYSLCSVALYTIVR